MANLTPQDLIYDATYEINTGIVVNLFQLRRPIDLELFVIVTLCKFLYFVEGSYIGDIQEIVMRPISITSVTLPEKTVVPLTAIVKKVN